MNWADLIMPTTTACNRPQTGGGGGVWEVRRPWDPERLTLGAAAGSRHPRFTRYLPHDNCVYEVGRSHGGLTECSELLFLNGHGFVLSLFPTRGTAAFPAHPPAAAAVIRLGRQQVLLRGPARRVGPGVHDARAGAGELGVRFAGGPQLLLQVLGEPPAPSALAPAAAAVTAKLLGEVVPGGGVGLGGQARPLHVAGVARVAG